MYRFVHNCTHAVYIIYISLFEQQLQSNTICVLSINALAQHTEDYIYKPNEHRTEEGRQLIGLLHRRTCKTYTARKMTKARIVRELCATASVAVTPVCDVYIKPSGR